MHSSAGEKVDEEWRYCVRNLRKSRTDAPPRHTNNFPASERKAFLSSSLSFYAGRTDGNDYC